MKLIAFMVLINIIAIIHELGHYFAARFTGTTVKKFSIGLGRKLFSWNRNGTEFCLSLIPIGGYIKMAGDDDTVPAKPTDPEGYFVRKTLLQRTSIIAAGPLFNFLLGFCLIIALFTFFGEPYVETVTITLDQGSVGNSESAAAPVKDMRFRELNFQYAVLQAVLKSVGIAYHCLVAFSALVTGNLGESLVGPVKMISYTGKAANFGVVPFLLLLGFFSINMAFLNLLPIPGLDGGYLLFYAYEAAFRKKPNPVTIGWFKRIGMGVLLGLMGYVVSTEFLEYIVKLFA